MALYRHVLGQLAAVNYFNPLASLATIGSIRLDQPYHLHALFHLPKNAVLAIEPGSLLGRDEELRAIGVGTSVGHGQKARLGVLELEVLISKFGPIDRFSTSSVEVGEVSALQLDISTALSSFVQA